MSRLVTRPSLLVLAAILCLVAIFGASPALAQDGDGDDETNDGARTPVPAPTVFGFKSSTDTSATLEWNTSPLADRFRLEYKETADKTWIRKLVNAASSGNTSTTVSGLTCDPATEYEFRVSAWGDGPGDPIPYGPPTNPISRTFDCEPDPYIVTYDRSSYSGDEGDSVSPVVSITPTPNRSITVGLTATTGTTESGDYTRTATQARFNATTTSVRFNVNFADDNDCDDEDFSLGFSGLPDDVETGTQAAPTVAIEDDDNCVVNISASPTNPAENSNVTVTVSIPSNSPVSNRSLSIPVVVAAGTAEAGDYSVSGLPVTISPGSRSATFTISVSEDALEDCENDTVIARFGARRSFPDNVVTGSSTSVTIVIQDDEPPEDCEPDPYIVTYDRSSYSGDEGDSVSPVVSITPTPNRSITVGLTATTGTTESGDYTRTATQARFNATTTSVRFNVNFVNENDCDDEDFSLGFSGLPDDVETGTQAAPTVAIEDDDDCVVNISASPTNPAENSNVTVTVSIPSNSPISNRSLSIPVVVAAGTAEAGDYSVSGLPVTISPGSRSATFTISVSEDALEDCENDTVIGRFGARRSFPDNVVTGSSTSVTIVIQDDEPPEDCEPDPYIVTYDRSSYSGDEGDSVSPVVSITPTPNRSITVGLTATTGTTESGDYTRTATQARFNATTTSVRFNVNFVNENDCDDEDFSLGFSGLPDDVETGTQAAPTVAIEDDDDCVVNISASPTNPAENSNVTVTVSIPSNSPISNRSLSIPVVVAAGTAEAGDYSVSGLPVTISPGSRSATFTISVSEDALEDCENDTVIGRFGARRSFPDNVVTGSSTSVTIVIQDDEPPEDCEPDPYIVTYDRSSYSGDEGDSVSPVVSITPTPNRSIQRLTGRRGNGHADNQCKV